MNKGLEALERLRFGKASNSDISLIERELKRLEELETRFATLKTNYNMVNDLCKKYRDECVKQREILRITKEKNVNVRGIINAPTLEHYDDHCRPRHSKSLTQQEFDLLKEIYGC